MDNRNIHGRDLSNCKMLFGSHKGKRFKDLPDSYIVWLFEDADDIRGELKVYVDDMYASAKTNVMRNK